MKQSLQKLVLLKLSIMLTNSAIWVWHSPPAISIRFLLSSNGVEILIFQGNFLNHQSQGFLIIGIIREHGSMFFWSRIRTSIIHGCSIFHLRINFPLSHFGSTIGGLIMVRLLRFFLSPSWMALSYSEASILKSISKETIGSLALFLRSLKPFTTKNSMPT